MQTKLKSWLTCAVLVSACQAFGQDRVEVVDRPNSSGTNHHYVSNRHPLKPSQLIQLPVQSIQARGWLRSFLQRQREGLTGNLGEISGWLQKEDNAWLSKDGKGKYGWEEVPYWLRGYIELAYDFNDPDMIAESHFWIEGVLASQRPDGDFGPDQRFEDGTRDYWANMVMLVCLQTYYEKTGDPRVLDLMGKYFRHQYNVPDEKLLTHYWQKMRGGDNIASIHWLYNRTGDPELLRIVEKIHRCTADWRKKGDLPDWHNVNVAECFREPAQYFLQSHDPADLKATYANFEIIRKQYGQVPGGLYGSDENCRPGYDDPRQAVETCGMVEHMFSDQMLAQITGDIFWADNCEDIAFNTYPAAVMPDFRALRYLTAPNMVLSDRHNHAPGIANSGPFLMMNPFSSRCCQHNHSHGWPDYNRSLWMATPDNGVCAVLYSASEAVVRVGDGTKVRLIEDTRYPFEETVRIQIATPKPVSFPLYLRIPGWCEGAQVHVNGKTIKPAAAAGKYVMIDREWKDRDFVELEMPMKINVRRWTANHDSLSVNYGPLTFSLKIGERYDPFDSSKTAIGDSHWQKTADPAKWPSFEIHPTTPWNYGLVVDERDLEKSFQLQRLPWPADDFPFTLESAPIQIKARGRLIPEWSIDRFGLCAPLQDSPAYSREPVREITLVPMGAARLRISAFPVVSSKRSAHRWIAPILPKPAPYATSASHVHDSLEAMCDDLVPASSGDHDVPRFTWWPHTGTREWVQYEFKTERKVSAVSVYWFDDTGIGRCRIPASWTLLYREGEMWKPVSARGNFEVKKDGWSDVEFQPVRTTALRLEATLQGNFSGGILEWRVQP